MAPRQQQARGYLPRVRAGVTGEECVAAVAAGRGGPGQIRRASHAARAGRLRRPRVGAHCGADRVLTGLDRRAFSGRRPRPCVALGTTSLVREEGV
jgi:hypothetical protein